MSWNTINLMRQLGSNIGSIIEDIKQKKEKEKQNELIRQIMMPYFKKKVIPEYSPEEQQTMLNALSQLSPSQWGYLSLLLPKKKEEPKKVIYEYQGLSKNKSTDKEKTLTPYEKWKKQYDKAIDNYTDLLKIKQYPIVNSDIANDLKKTSEALKEKVAYWERKGVEKGYLNAKEMGFSNLKNKYLPQTQKPELKQKEKEELKEKIENLQKNSIKSSTKKPKAEDVINKYGFKYGFK